MQDIEADDLAGGATVAPVARGHRPARAITTDRRRALERLFGEQAALDPLPELLQAWPAVVWPAEPIRVRTPTRGDVRTLRFLIIAASLFLVGFLAWLIRPEHRGDPLLYWPLTLALLLRAVVWGLEWFNYWRLSAPPPPAEPKRPYSVDVFTTACPGEPRGMILRTLMAIREIRHPHTAYLCDEGNDPVLRRACQHFGVIHLTRKDKRNAKAGNINNALAHSHGDLCVVLDPDHQPSPDFLDRVVGYFDDPRVGFVQSVQGYYNHNESAVARGAAEQTFHFYGPIMMGMHGRGTTQAIGANCVFRRTALQSIGGHAAGLAEDMHTSMQLYAAGWRSVYLPEVLTKGLVPSTLSAFYKQQVKWACGAFDLLFQVYPKLFSRFTLWQKIHYALAPAYFLSGLVTFVALSVPILCLLSGRAAWQVTLPELLLHAAPLACMGLLIRQTAQRFMPERHERGFHLTGGLLAQGSWWAFLTGVVCAVFRVKVPYIPTPKEGEQANDWRIVIPNLMAAGLSLAAVVYGLSWDASPYALLMSAFALWNAVAMLTVSAWGQQRLLKAVREMLNRPPQPGPIARCLGGARQKLLAVLRHGSPVGALVVLAAIAGPRIVQNYQAAQLGDLTAATSEHQRYHGPFLTGVTLPGSPAEWPAAMAAHRAAAGNLLSLAEVRLPIGTDPATLAGPLRALGDARCIPVIILSHPSGTPIDDAEIVRARGAGAHDEWLRRLAVVVRDAAGPVFVRPLPPAGPTSGDGPAYKAAWWRTVEQFNNEGVANIGWVWKPAAVDPADPAAAAAVAEWFPGPDSVDWMDIDLAAWPLAGTLPLSEQVSRIKAVLPTSARPILISDLGSDATSTPARLGELSALSEGGPGGVAGVLLRAGNAELGEAVDRLSPPIIAALRRPKLEAGLAPQPLTPGEWERREQQAPPLNVRHCVEGEPGAWRLVVDGRPMFIRGVAYNPGHDWRDGETPLIRRQIESDFRQIREMGGNAIRRYGPTWGDRNLFAAAETQGIKVLYGFHLAHDVDYLQDAAKLEAYDQLVEQTILEYRDHPALLGWTVGNEVWGLLKHHYGQPYLTHARRAHIAFVERITRRIKSLDPHHPVFVTHEHSEQLAGTIHAYAKGAPSVDVQAVNSYFDPHVSQLAGLFARFDPSRPYLVAEFGPDGYWHHAHTPRTTAGQPIEGTALVKAEQYARRWNEQIASNPGQCVGGFAYCWRDRYEGSTSWFGIVDWKNRPKPSYFALQRAWTGASAGAGLPNAPKILAFDAPAGPLSPGSNVRVSARIGGSGQAECTWTVTGRNFEPDVATVTPSADGFSAMVKLPARPAVYQIHLQVRGEGGLDEATAAIVVAKDGDGAGRILRRDRTSKRNATPSAAAR